MTLRVDLIHINIVVDQQTAHINGIAFNGIMKCIVASLVVRFNIDTTLFESVKNTLDNFDLRLSLLSIHSQYMHQILTFFIDLLNNRIFGRFRNESQEEIEFAFIQSVLHC